MYFACHCTTNNYLRGIAFSNSPQASSGFNSPYYNSCSFFCVIHNSSCTSLACVLHCAYCPLYTYSSTLCSSNSNLCISGTSRNKSHPFGVSIFGDSNTRLGSVRFTHPLTKVSTTATSGVYMYKLTTFVNHTPCQTICATPMYGYSFCGWRNASTSGTVVNSNNPWTYYWSSSYGSPTVAFGVMRSIYATSISDKRLKKDIKLIGKSKKGYNIYSFKFKNPKKFGYGTYQGVIGQETPHATVMHPEGYLMVDYSKLDVKFKKLYGSNLGFGKRNKIRRFLQSIKNFIISSFGFSLEKVSS